MEEKKSVKKYHIIQLDVAKEITHGICVSNLAWRVGKRLSLSEVMCYNLAVAGFLHDIGKLEMAKYMNTGKYNREHTLRVEEMRYVRTHPALSYALLNEKGYPEQLTEWILYHHEKYDGSGYPANKSGDEIPLGARVLRVCDVFAALTANRPYRKAFDVKTAVELMIAEVKNFDMKVFLAFLQVVNSDEIQDILDEQKLKVEDLMGLEEFQGLRRVEEDKE